MRYGVLADIHGNLHALDAVLRELDSLDVDGYLVAGDIVGYGPQPNECVAVVAGLAATCVAGNHDLIALGRLSDDRCGRLARSSLRWTRSRLDDAARTFLAELPLHAEAPGGVVIAHGALDEPQTYVTDAARAAHELRRLAREHPAAGILVLGHTHAALAWNGDGLAVRAAQHDRLELRSSERWLLNPGAVGQSRERSPDARFMVLDLERGEASFRSTSYDVEGCRAALRREGLPIQSCHRRPGRAAGVRRRLRRLAGRPSR
jgi:predicted phosphodiesterase